MIKYRMPLVKEWRRTSARVFILSLGLVTLLSAQQQKPQTSRITLFNSLEIALPAMDWEFIEGEDVIMARALTDGNVLDPITTTVTRLSENLIFRRISANGNYAAHFELAQQKAIAKQDRNLKIAIRSAATSSEAVIDYVLPFDEGPPLLLVSDVDGASVIARATTGEISIYDAGGNLRQQHAVFPNADYDHERILNMALSADGRYLAVAAGKRGASPASSNAPMPSAEPHLILYSMSGEEIWREPLPNFNAGDVAISADGQQIVVGSYTFDANNTLQKALQIFDSDRKELTKTNLLFRQAAFSENGKYVIACEKAHAQIFDITDGRLLGEHRFSARNGMIADAAVDNQGNAVLLIARHEFRDQKFVYVEPQLRLLAANGQVAAELKLVGHQFNQPALHLDAGGRSIKVGMEKACLNYEVQP